MTDNISEISKMLGGHSEIIDSGLHVLSPETLEAIKANTIEVPKKDCYITLPVSIENQHLADEKYTLHGRGSIDELAGPVDDELIGRYK
jgi:hypothetical protein